MSKLRYDIERVENIVDELGTICEELTTLAGDVSSYKSSLPSDASIDGQVSSLGAVYDNETGELLESASASHRRHYRNSYGTPLKNIKTELGTIVSSIDEVNRVANQIGTTYLNVKTEVGNYDGSDATPEQYDDLMNELPVDDEAKMPESEYADGIGGSGGETPYEPTTDLTIDVEDGNPDIDFTDDHPDATTDIETEVEDGNPDIDNTDPENEQDTDIYTNEDGSPKINLDTNGDGVPDLNIDINGDGVPDVNIDTNGDGKADLNIDINGDGVPDVNLDTNGDGKADLNIDTNGDGKPDINLDTNGDGKADLNIDTNGDGKPDVNLDTNGDGKADLNIDRNGDGVPDMNVDTDGDGIPDLNVDTNSDGIPDLNVDKDGDGIPDTNVDTDGDGIADENIDHSLNLPVNVDTDGDGIPDLNIDSNGDGLPDTNIDLDGDGVPDVNVDTDGDGKPDKNVIPDIEGKSLEELLSDGALYVDEEGNVYMINEDGTISYPFAPGGLFYNQMLSGDASDQLGSIFGSHDSDSSSVDSLGIGFADESVKSAAAFGGIAAVGVAAANAAASMESVVKEQKEGIRGKDDKELSPEEIKARKIRTIISGAVLGVLTLANVIAMVMSGTSTLTVVLLGVALAVTSVITSFGNKYGKMAVPLVAVFNLFVSFVLCCLSIAPITSYVMAYLILAGICVYYYYMKIFDELLPGVDFVPVVAAVLIIGLIGLLMVTGLLLWWLGLIFLILTVVGYFAYNYFGLAQLEEEKERMKNGNKVSFTELALPSKKQKTINQANTFDSMKKSMISGGNNENKAATLNTKPDFMNTGKSNDKVNDLMKPMDK